ncbi:tyrosine-type recombinase/integrase [uncultured Adlercreutzia sp.]|uniref:tyrosine-type recombinase/integrase n=1 Tax=uncultured Adlercreutzia sp. TaxID=875803 RepID=UPI0026F3B530|nr:tyrosine-type recombinase/integrase [uncultured Adlercreutzia sp.]
MRINYQEIEDYSNYCKHCANLSANTVRAYRSDLLQYLEWQNEQGCPVTRETVREFVASLSSIYKPRTIKRKIASLRAFASYAAEKSGEQNPFLGFRLDCRVPKELPRTVPLSTLELILDSDLLRDETSTLSLRNRAIVELLLSTGVRVSELCNLNIANCDLSGKMLTVLGKGSKERAIQLECLETVLALERYLKTRSADAASAPLFLNRFGNRLSPQAVRNFINRLAKSVNAPVHITPHMFRHTFATILLEEDVDIRYIQHLLGHASIKTTEIYTHVSNAKQREVMRLHNPRDVVSRSMAGRKTAGRP